MMRSMAWLMGITALGLLLGCDRSGGIEKDDSGKAGSACRKDGDCRNGLLCEAKTCVPESVAKKARGSEGSDEGKAAEAATGGAVARPGGAPTEGNVAAPTCGSPSTVPVIPSERSNPPSGAEWEKGCPINTQGSGGQPSNCNMKIIREWLSVTCTGDVQGFEKMEDFGNEGQSYFKHFVPGQVGSFVVRLSKGTNQKVRICRTKDRASLFVSWPPSNDRPLHVALGSGPVCDGGDWGSAHKK